MPFKLFSIGEEALAADLNTYLAKQVVAQFPTVAARNSAITTPVTGQLSICADRGNTLDVWDGSAWIPAAPLMTGWTTYTPTWTAGGSSSVAIGTGGTLHGTFKMIAPYTIAIRVLIAPGTSGFNGGSGLWKFSLPAGYTYGAISASHAMVTGSSPLVGNTLVGSDNMLSPASTGPAGVAANWWSATFPIAWTNAYAGACGVVMQVPQRW